MLQIWPIPCLRDNYAWLIQCAESGAVGVVDPSEPGPVLAALHARGLRLDAIFNTHHHADHIGGNEGLLAYFPGIPVYAHHSDRTRIPSLSHPLEEGDQVQLGLARARVLHVPAHTRGAVAYVFENAVFTGDTLFSAGCGRLFEGTPAELERAMSKLEALPDALLLCCGHEYTVQNLRFAAWISPTDSAVAQRRAEAEALRAQQLPTVPVPLHVEKATNPFLRASDPALEQGASARAGEVCRGRVQTLGTLRRLKDQF
ncbi:MAG: hydroxyacylglutathione hydrolase [Myxococcota bacterium]